MEVYASEDLAEALAVILDTVKRSEKAQQGFAAGSPQHSLLKNRINALKVAKALMLEAGEADDLGNDELLDSISPICSIIRKCEKARCSFADGTSQHIRLSKLMKAMRIAESLISHQISIRGQ